MKITLFAVLFTSYNSFSHIMNLIINLKNASVRPTKTDTQKNNHFLTNLFINSNISILW